MNNGWKTGELGDFVELKRGYDLPASKRIDGGVPVVSSSGVSGSHNESKVAGPGVVTGRYGTIGNVYYLEQDFWPLNTTLYVRDFKGNDPRFIFYFLQTIDYDAYSDKAAVPGVNRNHLHLAKVSIPCIEEQRAVAETLNEFDSKIVLNRRMNETLEAMARAIFKSWFVDFDPVRAKAEGRQPQGIPAHVADLFPDSLQDSPLGPIPKGWEVQSLDNAMDIHDSKRVPLSSRERLQRQGSFPYYGATSVMDYVDDFLFDGIYLLIGEDGSVARDDGTPFTQYVWGRFWVNNHAHVLQGKGAVSTEHLYLFMKGCNVLPYVTGAVQAKLNQKNMKSIPFIRPSDDVCTAFAEAVAPYFGMIRLNSEESATLEETRDALLPKLLAGEVSVGGAA